MLAVRVASLIITSERPEREGLKTDKTEHYKRICSRVVKTLASTSRRLNPDYSRIDGIFTYYEEYRKIIQRNMSNKDSFTKTEPLMDNHKIAAAFLCSFLKARPLTYVPDSSGVAPRFGELGANVHGAFLFGLQVIQDFWEDKFNDSADDDDKEIYRKLIQLPEADTDTYIQWFIKLFLDGDVVRCFDYESDKFEEKLIFFVSHIYAMLESYSYQYYKTELYKSRSEYLSRELNSLKRRFQINA